MTFSALKKRALLVIVITVSAIITSTAYAQNAGTVWAWGNNLYGELGNGTNTISYVPVEVSNLSNVVEIAGDNHSLALKNDGTVWAWGDNEGGQLGNGTTSNSNVPIEVLNLSGVTAIAGGSLHSLALKNEGTVWTWGENVVGQLGNGTWTDSNVPVQVLNLSDVAAIAGGSFHSLALKNDGTVWSWGQNMYGVLGNGTSTGNSNVPVQVLNLSDVAAIAGGTSHSLTLKNNGTVWAWGNNSHGQLGNGTNTDSNVPIQVASLTGVSAIAAGSYHSLALKNDGTVWAWGDNEYGQLGNGTNSDSNVPVQILSLSGVAAIEGGHFHSLSLRNDGIVWAWGWNGVGQLGNGTTSNSNVPVHVLNLSSATAISGGGGHSLAIASGGTSCTITCTAAVPSTGAPGSSISFSSTATATPSGCITPSFDWDFGDGTAHSTLQNPTHSYAAEGTYNWMLTVSGSGVTSCVQGGTITISTTGCIIECNVSAPASANVGTAIYFLSTSTITPSGCTNPAYDWDFGDGSAHSNEQNPDHVYSSAGTYTWILTVSGTGATECQLSGTINISGGSRITISGHVMLEGQIGIKGLGDGDFDKVIARDAAGNAVESTVIASDGSYSVTLPQGDYTLVANIHYFDWHLATNDPVIRYSQVKLPNSPYNESRTIDFVFPSPIVFIHGIRSDWKKWNDWILEINTFYPDQIVFTPGYDDGANYEDEANYLYQHLELDFSKLAVGTPDFKVIAHSKGGLVARVFKNYYNGYPLGNAMKDLIMLGTPNNGSDCASLNNIGGCTLYNLCECQVGQLVNVPYPNLTGMGGHVHVVAGTKANALSCTYVVSNCTDTEDSDGIVTAYSVFHAEDSQYGGSYPGIAVPFNHCELGSAQTKFLLSGIIMPYYSTGDFPQCPISAETTPQIKLCGSDNPTPLFSNACMKGNGYIYGSCTANLPQEGTSSTELFWTAPANDGTSAAPSDLTAESTTNVSNCSSGAMESIDQTDGTPTLLGYQIYRSTDENMAADDSHRIGYIAADKNSFVDTTPTNIDNYYVVTALYDQGESVPSNVASTQSVEPPTLSNISKLTAPFRLRVTGSNLKSDLRVYIGEDTSPWPSVKVKNSNLVIIKGGANLKSKFPKGWQVGITIVNGDGGTSTIYYRR